MSRRPLLCSFIAAVAAACAGPANPASPAPGVAAVAPTPATAREAIRASDIERDLRAFSDDSMLGRSAETGDAVRAARFLAARAQAIGLEPAGDSGGYLQRVPLIREYLGKGSKVTVATDTGTVALEVGPLVLPVVSLGEGLPLPRLDASGDLLFGGYGLTGPDVSDELAGKSVSGKVVVFLMESPPGLDSAARAAMEREHPLAERIGVLADRGPAAIVAVVSGRTAAMLAPIAAEMRDSAARLGDSAGAAPRTLPLVLLVDRRVAGPLLPAGWPGKPRLKLVAPHAFTAHVAWVRAAVPAFNVVAVRRGADPRLRNSYVAFGAHLDHIGIQPPVDGDSIANGADDDGSGSVALLAIARAAVAQRPPPQRSMLFVWHTGEELGLFGSEWFTTHPTVPIDSIVAQLNADMIGRNARDSLYLVGPRAAPNHRGVVLGAIADSVNATLKPPFAIDRDWDSPTHPEQIYYRSDHYNYARTGIPVIFFTSGLHADYHKVSDEVGKIEFDKVARVALFIYEVGLAVADRPTRPLNGPRVTTH